MQRPFSAVVAGLRILVYRNMQRLKYRTFPYIPAKIPHIVSLAIPD